jgi:uncharacterized protein YecE (DUF72 family)
MSLEPAGPGRVRVGTSGWTYDSWQDTFFPAGLARRRRLEYLGSRMDTAEVNGTFYSLQRASSFRTWAEATPEDFRFAVKGSRYITHMKKLRDVEEPLGRFFASGLLALGAKLGPVLWQLPPNLRWDAERVEGFLRLLPRTTGEAAALAAGHADRVPDPWTVADEDRPLRYALEVRHPSSRSPEVVALLRAHDVALVVSDGAGEFPRFDDVTADLVYVRLHGQAELYRGAYDAGALETWAARARAWAAGRAPVTDATIVPDDAAPERSRGREVFVYFDNDAEGHAPHDALALAARLSR